MSETVNSVTPETITVYQQYHAAYNEVVQPDKYVVCSRYFIRRWMPELKGVATQIVLALRSLGFYDPKTSKLRDGVEIDLPTLAEMLNVHPATIKREFTRNEALALFVQRESQYRKDPVTGQILRTINVYRIKMDDPIHALDLPKLQECLDAKDKPPARKAHNAPNAIPSENPCKAQFAQTALQVAQQIVQSAQPIAQSAQPALQNAPTLKDYSLRPKNTLKDSEIPPSAARSPDPDFLSLSQKQTNTVQAKTAVSEKPLPSSELPQAPLQAWQDWEAQTPEYQAAYRQARRVMPQEAMRSGRPVTTEADWDKRAKETLAEKETLAAETEVIL